MVLMVMNMPANAGDLRDTGGHGNPLQYSCPEYPMDRRAWWATVHGITKELDTTEVT